MVVVESVLILIATILLLLVNKLIETEDRKHNIRFICCVLIMVLFPDKLELMFGLSWVISLIISAFCLYVVKVIGDKIC